MQGRDVFIIQAGYNWKWASLAYSYDYKVSKLTNQNIYGNHEINLTAIFNSKKNEEHRKGVSLIAF